MIRNRDEHNFDPAPLAIIGQAEYTTEIPATTSRLSRVDWALVLSAWFVTSAVVGIVVGLIYAYR